MTDSLCVFWFRRDLRLDDNAGLYQALKENKTVLPVFIFDTQILSRLTSKNDRRVDFIHQAIGCIQEKLLKLGSGLTVFNSTPEEAFEQIRKTHKVRTVYCNNDYEPYAISRDQKINSFLKSKGIAFKNFKDQCVFEKDEVVKEDGSPYTVFTPYSRKWKNKLTAFYYKSYPCENYFDHFIQHDTAALPSLKSLGFTKTDLSLNPELTVSELLLSKYKEQRDFPGIEGTTRLSIYLRFGVVSIRSLVSKAIPISETWLNELIWRDFYMMILWHFPHVAQSAFKPAYQHIPWRNNENDFEKWCHGRTGFPIVDAGIRELNATGFMHNRVRMIVSSFLVKDLLIDWRWGEAYFADLLNDFDLSANNGGWQWAAGCGCDAAPYFRIFNPTEQQKRFDPEFTYIKKWVPEFGTNAYPLPMLDHANARKRTLEVYKKALLENKQMALF